MRKHEIMATCMGNVHGLKIQRILRKITLRRYYVIVLNEPITAMYCVDKRKSKVHYSNHDFKPCLLIPNDLFAASPQKEDWEKITLKSAKTFASTFKLLLALLKSCTCSSPLPNILKGFGMDILSWSSVQIQLNLSKLITIVICETCGTNLGNTM